MDNLQSQISLFRRLRATNGDYVCRSPFCPTHFWNAQFSLKLAPLLVMSVSHEMYYQTSVLHRNRALCAGVGLLPVISHPYRRTLNFSITIVWYHRALQYIHCIHRLNIYRRTKINILFNKAMYGGDQHVSIAMVWHAPLSCDLLNSLTFIASLLAWIMY